MGKNAVLISEDEWKLMKKHYFYPSISGYVENINNIRESENWESAKKYERDEEW